MSVDVQGYDKFGRALGVVFCDGKDICEWMVRNGLAIVAYSEKYKDQEQHARQNKLGIWVNQISCNPKYWKTREKGVSELIFRLMAIVVQERLI